MQPRLRHLRECSSTLVIQTLKTFGRSGFGSVLVLTRLPVSTRFPVSVPVGLVTGIIASLVVAWYLDRHDLGMCQPEMIISNDHFCWLPTEGTPFRVIDGRAITPWPIADYDADPDREQVKIDAGTTGKYAFQAIKVTANAWKILLNGPWHTIDQCTDGMKLVAGQQCIEEKSNDSFRVYATDEWNTKDQEARKLCMTHPDDCRPFYSTGYGVFYSFPEDCDGPSPMNGRINDSQVLIDPSVDPKINSDGNIIKFVADRITGPSGPRRGDAWILRKIDDRRSGQISAQFVQVCGNSP